MAEILKSVATELGNTVELIGEDVKNRPLIIGVFHGDEPQGKYLIEKYLEMRNARSVPHSSGIPLSHNSPTSESKIPRWGNSQETERSLSRRTSANLPLFIPCLNPDGLAENKRTNANSVDLNRNFPTKNWGKNEGENATCDDETTAYYGGNTPASEVETQFVIDVIEKYSPSIILTLHAPYKVVNYDGPAKEIAELISEIIDYPAEGSIGYPTPGSFGTYCGVERNIPTITLELDEEIPVENLIQPVFEIFDLLSDEF